MNATVTVTKEQLEFQKTYDAVAAWLRDCVWRGDKIGAAHAEVRLKALEVELAKAEGEKECLVK